MNKFLMLLLAIFFSTAVFAEGTHSTPTEAQAMVKKAIAYLMDHDQEKAFVAFQNPQGPFRDRDLYISVLDLHGNMIAHGTNPKIYGKYLLEFDGSDGEQLVKDRLDVLNTRHSGWQDYKYVDPITKAIEPKTVYFEKMGDLVISCGSYKQ